MEEENMYGRMENVMTECMTRIKNKVLEYFIGPMVDNFRDIGKMANNMGKVL